MWNLIFSLCNQRTDKVQICSTDTRRPGHSTLVFKTKQLATVRLLVKENAVPWFAYSWPLSGRNQSSKVPCYFTLPRWGCLGKTPYYLQRFMEQRQRCLPAHAEGGWRQSPLSAGQ